MLLKTFYALIGSVIPATVIGEHGESISSLFTFVTMYIYIPGPEEAICEWSGRNFTQYSCTNERILLEIVTEASVCEAHSEMRSMSLLGGSGGMPPQENFEKLDTQICHFRVLYCKN